MTDTRRWNERRIKVARYRMLAQETTDPLAAGLLRDIVAELEADLQEVAHAIEVKLAEPPVVVGTADADLQPVLDGMKAVATDLKAALVPAV